MKKSNKIATAFLCLGLVITTLSACSNSVNNDTKPEPTEESTEVVITVEHTEETIADTTVEPTTEPAGDEVIPLYSKHRIEEVQNAAAEDFFNYENFIYFFSPIEQLDDKTYSDCPLHRFAGNTPYSFVIRPQNPEGTERTTLEIYFYKDNMENIGYVYTYYEADNGESGMMVFIPLFYDQADQSLVGFYSTTTGTYTFVKLYYDPIGDVIETAKVDRADYF